MTPGWERGLQLTAAVCSVLGLAVSLWTLALVARLRAGVKRHSRRRKLLATIDKVCRIPATKLVLPESTCQEVRFVVETARYYDLSWWWFLDRPGKRAAANVERELDGERRRGPVQDQLELLRDELSVP